METLNDITDNFTATYNAKCALVFYETDSEEKQVYVEYYDIDGQGQPRNAHSLSVLEADRLYKSLETQVHAKQTFLKPSGLLPQNVLHIDPAENGSVLWYTKAALRPMFFVPKLGIPNGAVHVPALLWKASREGLALYALPSDKTPNENTALYYAPFFNIYKGGRVCMGTVDIQIKSCASLETFILAWEQYFFNSYFSHLLDSYNPVKGNCVGLWKSLVETGAAFPKSELIKNNMTLKNLLS
ncbi:PRTRC system protein B [Flavobacterium sp. Sd200]|uniref:PRTRC system protein B n=1 Tax=Flavobacterium sp. Sd200 TaxID=2692211 RepID=UPI001370D0E8|nr:PRTRC system protein B [Flavobacterium sp. Sd200]MXN90813.1 PRTRC system protein B [Flavobacterium sp. Sd200]